MVRRHDLTGQVFGRLTALHYVNGRWECRCSCGGRKAVVPYNLVHGVTRSCGCLRVEATRRAFTTHGMTKSTEYRIWYLMKDRCTNPNNKAWSSYGGRGITVCKRWEKFENFYADMGVRPQGTTLDRINNNRGYSKSNCRWASMRTQSYNKRTTIRFQGKTLDEWCDELGQKYTTLYRRLRQTGTVFSSKHFNTKGP